MGLYAFNVGGLIYKDINKFEDPLFLKQLNKFDIMFLVETHIGNDFNIPNIGPFHSYNIWRPQSRNYRNFGGLAVLTRISIKPHIKILPNHFNGLNLKRNSLV